VAELVADFGGNVSSIDRILIEQAAWLLVQAEDLQRARNSNRPASDGEMTRAANGAARILLRLRDGRRDSGDEMTLARYAAVQGAQKANGA
jgi:hypothetical protein